MYSYSIEKIRKIIKIKLLRNKVKNRKFTVETLSSKENWIYKIVTNAICDKRNVIDAEANYPTEFMITFPEENMFIIVGHGNVQITNHSYHYDNDISKELSIILNDKIGKEHDRRIFFKKQHRLKNVVNGLKMISEKLELNSENNINLQKQK